MKKGPRLTTKLLLLSILFLGIPWLGYQYLQELKNFLQEGQMQSLRLMAQTLTAQLSDDELFSADTGGTIDEAFYPYPYLSSIVVDGYDDDWRDLPVVRQSFKRENHQPGFNVRTGLYKDSLYIFLEITDSHLVFRQPGSEQVNTGDHVRLSLRGTNEHRWRYIITTDGPGEISAYRVGRRWKSHTGMSADHSLQGYLRETANGYTLELSLPLNHFSATPQLNITVADSAELTATVSLNQDQKEPSPLILTSTGPASAPGKMSPIILRSDRLEQRIKRLGWQGSRIWVLDPALRVRALAGEFKQPDITAIEPDPGVILQILRELAFRWVFSLPMEHFSDLNRSSHIRTGKALGMAIQGETGLELRPSADGRADIVMVAVPILHQQTVTGIFLVEQSTNEIVDLQRHTLQQILGITLLVFAIITVGLLLFAWRLTWRLHQLESETEQAIDDHGRVIQQSVNASANAGDELGDLSRGITSLLTRLGRYTQFLERVPRILRHEISNPLNTVSTSLHNLVESHPEMRDSRYLQSAERGIHRLDEILQTITQASRLEDALHKDDMQRFDLCRLISTYGHSLKDTQTEYQIRIDTPAEAVYVNGSDHRIEQLLDKLIDNAIDFTPIGKTITLSVKATGDAAFLLISNDGPRLSTDANETLFGSMISLREPGQDERPHLGIGLFVTRLITEHHGGHIRIQNREDRSGVVVTLELPRIQ